MRGKRRRRSGLAKPRATPSGKVRHAMLTEEGETIYTGIPVAWIRKCPHRLLDLRHYDMEKGVCRCSDKSHGIMRSWGYWWNKDCQQWQETKGEVDV